MTGNATNATNEEFHDTSRESPVPREGEDLSRENEHTPSDIANNIRVVLPEFNDSFVEAYFDIAEAQFAMHKVYANKQRYRLVLSRLPPKLVASIDRATKDAEDYKQLKDILVSRHQKSKPELFRKMIRGMNPRLIKPSAYMAELINVAQQLDMGQGAVRLQFMESLPKEAARILIGSSDVDLQELAKIADRIMDYPDNRPMLNHVSSNSFRQDSYSNEQEDQLYGLNFNNLSTNSEVLAVSHNIDPPHQQPASPGTRTTVPPTSRYTPHHNTNSRGRQSTPQEHSNFP